MTELRLFATVAILVVLTQNMVEVNAFVAWQSEVAEMKLEMAENKAQIQAANIQMNLLKSGVMKLMLAASAATQGEAAERQLPVLKNHDEGGDDLQDVLDRVSLSDLIALLQGRDGDTGPRGPPGPPGRDGSSGSPGPVGATGSGGAQGLPGRDGQPGPRGGAGEAGTPGLPGNPGSEGPPGAPGNQSAPGEPGEPGRNGLPGRTGQKGDQGSAGSPGFNGQPGFKGAVGPMGQKGQCGSNGQPGLPGFKGEVGETGANGVSGLQGQRGPTGATGAAGPKGDRGLRGYQGSNGLPGARAEEVAGSVYTRWGRRTCGCNSTRLYEGFAAGGFYNHNGGGTNYQCLPLVPQFDEHNETENAISWIYGAEYETHGYPARIPTETFDQNVPCASCYSSRTAKVMIPARQDCPVGWSREYHGYLMSAYYNHAHPSTYECVDATPDYISGQSADTAGALFYFVKPDCSGIGTIGHCPPYNENKKILCVVCTK